MATLGVHYILELCDCPVDKLDDPEFVTSSLRAAAGLAQSTLLQEISHRFEPQGVTALALLAESHISIHTWPENGYAAVDIFTCGQTTKPEKACAYLVKRFEAGTHTIRRITRGAGAAAAQPDESAVTDNTDGKKGAPWQAQRYVPISG